MDQSMQMNTSYRKGRGGWRGETNISLGPVQTRDGPGERRLEIRTYHYNSGIGTFASVSVVRDGMTTFEIFGDYSKLQQHTRCRCTEAAVKKQHASMVDEPARMRDLLALVAKHYEAKDAAAALNAKRDADLAAHDAQQSGAQVDETAHFRAA